MGSYYLCSTAALDMGLSSSAYKLYHVLAASADNKTRSSFKKKATLAAEIGASESTVFRAAKELVKAGLLKIEKRFRNYDGKQSANIYTLLDEPQIKISAADRAVIQNQSQRFDCPAGGQNLPGTALKVLCFLQSTAGKSGVCKIHLARISQTLKLSVSTIRRAVFVLKEKGFLAVKYVSGDMSVYCLSNGFEDASTAQNQQMEGRQDPFEILKESNRETRRWMKRMAKRLKTSFLHFSRQE